MTTKFTELPNNADISVIQDWIKKEIFHGDLAKLTKKILRERITELEGPMYVDANFTEQFTCSDVMAKLPPINDACLRLVPNHYLLVSNGKELKEGLGILSIPLHYRRTLTIEGGIQIFRNFYTADERFLGETITADITIQLKTDLTTRKQTLVIDYENIRDKKTCRATHAMKIGVGNGQVSIPGTKKFVEFKKL